MPSSAYDAASSYRKLISGRMSDGLRVPEYLFIKGKPAWRRRGAG
jgi:hypothetical protein